MSKIEFIRLYELDRERSLRTRSNHRPITLAASAAPASPPEAILEAA